MLRRTSRTDVYAIAASAALAIGGMLIVRSGETAGWWLLLACSLAAGAVILKPALPTAEADAEGESLDISAWGVRRYDESGLHEAVSWADLREVTVVTTPEQGDAEDVYLVLQGKHNNGLIVSHTLAVESGILAELHNRLSDFDSQAFIDALASTVARMFVLWRAPTPVSPLHSGARSTTPVQLRAAS